MVQQIARQLLRHTLRQRGYQHTLTPMLAGQYLVHQVVNLVFALAHLNLGIQQSRRPDHLFHHHALGLFQLVVGGGSRHVDHLVDHLVEFLEGQRTVVEGGRQTETILHEVGLAGAVTTVHRPYLGHRHMTLVDDHQVVFREEIQQAVGPFARLAPIEIAAVVLDARAMPQLLDHLHIILHALLDALRLDAVAQLLEIGHLLHQVVLDLTDGDVGLLLRGHKEVGGIELVFFEACQTVEGHRIHLLEGVDLIIPEGHAQHHLTIRHRDVHGVALHTEVATLQIHVVAHVESGYQIP